MPDFRPPFTYNPASGRYKDAAGKFVPNAEVRAAVDVALAKADRRASALLEQLRLRRISLADWQLAMQREISSVHIYNAVLAKGGKNAMTAADYGRVGNEIKRQYQYLRRFAEDIAFGKPVDRNDPNSPRVPYPLDGRAAMRANLYTQSGRQTYHTVELRERQRQGFTEYRNIRAASDSCEGCMAATRAGWVPIGTLKPIGQRDCLSSCKCSWLYRRPKRQRFTT
jgi:hypothetical protein